MKLLLKSCLVIIHNMIAYPQNNYFAGHKNFCRLKQRSQKTTGNMEVGQVAKKLYMNCPISWRKWWMVKNGSWWKINSCIWLHSLKRDADGMVNRYKATKCFVVKISHAELSNTLAAVHNFSTGRLMISLTDDRKGNVHQVGYWNASPQRTLNRDGHVSILSMTESDRNESFSSWMHDLWAAKSTSAMVETIIRLSQRNGSDINADIRVCFWGKLCSTIFYFVTFKVCPYTEELERYQQSEKPSWNNMANALHYFRKELTRGKRFAIAAQGKDCNTLLM